MKKRLLSVLLVTVLVFSMGSIAAMAQGEFVVVIDGKRDAVYKDSRYLDPSCWQYWADDINPTEPVDPERVTNHLWFTWNGEYVYLYFQVTSKDPLYQPPEGETVPPNRSLKFYEQIDVYLDTAPSDEYLAPCMYATEENPECNHFCCNAREGDGKGYRLMTRLAPAWDNWNNFFDSDAGLFFTFGEFYDTYCTPGAQKYKEEYAKNPLNAYLQSNGAGEVASFIDYETNTYGFEMKYRRASNEDYFKINIVTSANEKEWDEGIELGYKLSVCAMPWLNHEGMIQICYDDYGSYHPSAEELAQEKEEQRGKAVRELIDSLPETVTTDCKGKVEYCHALYNMLSSTAKAMVTNHDRLLKAETDLGDLFNPPKEGEFSVYDVETMISALPAIINKDSGPAIAAARQAYDSLDPFYQALVTNYSDLVQAEEWFDNIGKAMYGEVTGDGKVDAKDALEVLKASVKKVEFTPLQMLAAEVDGIEGIGARDALEILKYTVKKIDKFPIQQGVETPTDVTPTDK